MAAGSIITVLTNVPWSSVLEAAPKLAEVATKLLNAVIRRKKEEAPDQSTPAAIGQVSVIEVDPLEKVRWQISFIQTAVDNLKEEMQSATELIKLLAEQNAVLVQRVELNRMRLVRQAFAGAIVGLAMLAGITYLLLRP